MMNNLKDPHRYTFEMPALHGALHGTWSLISSMICSACAPAPAAAKSGAAALMKAWQQRIVDAIG